MEKSKIIENDVCERYSKSQSDYKSKYGNYCFPGSIVIAVLGECQGIIDGQHRLEAMKRLYSIDKSDFIVSVEYIQCYSEDHIDELYIMINNISGKNTMITKGNIDISAHKLKIVVDKLTKSFPEVFHHKKTIFPYVNISIFEDKLKKKGILKIKPPEEVLKIILDKNIQYESVIENDKIAHKKAIHYGRFFLHYNNPKSLWLDWVFDDSI